MTSQEVSYNLLDEGVPIRDMRTILDSLLEHAPKIGDAHELTAAVRLALGRAITQQWYPGNGDLQVMGLDPTLERVLSQALSTGRIRGSRRRFGTRRRTRSCAAESRAAAGAACSTRCGRCSRGSCGGVCRS